MRPFPLAAFVLPCACAILFACADDATERQDGGNGFVGQVEGTNAFVSAVPGANTIVVYVCNGDEQLSSWFDGPLADDGTFLLSNVAGDAVSGQVTDSNVTGEFTSSGGPPRAFGAEPMSGEGGLYRAMGDVADDLGIWAGWVLNDTGEERGALTRGSLYEPTPSFDGSGLRIEGETVPIYQFKLQTPSSPSPIPVPYPNTGTVSR